jgi:hypothetical protein
MPMNRETGKDRWRRIPKDYFKGRDRLQTWKLSFWVLALILAVGWFALGVDWKNPTNLKATDVNSLRANHGTLAWVHEAWDNKCEACHVPFEPIDGRSLFASASSPSNRSSDKLCMSCHAGPKHHEAAKAEEVKGCAECHRDHMGREASLVQLDDHDCTRCHSALEQHFGTKDPNSRTFGNVTRFEKDHPPFAPEAATKVGEKLQDRSKLKFNHARHMMPGIVKTLGDTPYTVEKIPLASERSRYQKAGKPGDPVQLNCQSCHQLDSSEIKASPNPAFAKATLLSRNPGRYYLPITFENQCRACHTLTFDPAIPNSEVPHGVQPDKVVEFLNRTYAAQVLSDDPKLLDAFVPPVRIPGKTPVEATAKKRLDEAVSKALTFMFPTEATSPPALAGNKNNCLECHYYGQEATKGIPNRVEPTKVPEIWFTHARFAHTAHRAVSCRECHSRSYAMNEDGKTLPNASSVATDVLIPGLDNCVKCHAPARGQGSLFGSSSASITGGVWSDCTGCHRYHNGDQPLQGSGASSQDATAERTIEEFLRGTDGRPKSSSATKSPQP